MLELVKTPLPPSNIQAEQLLLGGMILGNSQTDRVVSFLKSEDFQEAVHQRIYQAICDDLAIGKMVSPVLLRDRFEEDGSLRDIGGAEYLSRLASAAITVIGVLDFAKEIYDLAKKRQLLELCQTIRESVYEDQGKSSDEIINQISSMVTEISFNPSRSNIKTSKQVTMMIYEDLKQESACYSTGLESLDKSMQGGLYAGKCYGFAARKKQGKTLLASSISHNLNQRGIKHLFVCAEMGQKEIHQRNVARALGHNSLSFINENRSTIEFLEGVKKYTQNDPGNIYYLDAPGILFEELKRKIAYAVQHHKIKGVILDYWQLVGGKRKGQSTSEHQDEVAQWLSDYCRQEKLFGVVMAQVNQSGTTRGSEGIRLAFDQIYHLQRIEGTQNSFMEMWETRYAPWRDVGTEMYPEIYIKDEGPHFSDL